MKNKPTKPCKHCHVQIVVNSLARHENRCDGKGPIRFSKAIANENGKYHCYSCGRDFETANARSHHNCDQIPRRCKLSEYPYSHVWFITCKATGKLFCSQNAYTLYHPSAQLALRTYRARASFKFNVYDYPDKFAISFIKEYGWYSPGGKTGNNIRNINGVSRDHLYSVYDGWINNVDPALLAHPANCQLLLQKDNILKKNKSSISLEELKERIQLWK